MVMLKKIGRLFQIKTRLEAWLVIYAIALGAVDKALAELRDTGRMTEAQKGALSREMAAKVENVKKLAPTRAHPMTPNEGAVRTVAGPVASLLDHLRDAVSGRGKTTG